MAETTIRYRAASRFVYANALFELVMHARASSDDFTFGPTKLDALERNGLTISGPDLAGVQEALAGIPGLVEEG